MRSGRPIEGVHIWVVPRANPDGAVRDTRQNARGVDLNRNWPYQWKRVTGYYNSGRRPASEPETRSLKRFLNRVRPDYVVNIHQPLFGLDVTRRQGQSIRAAACRVELNLPNRHLHVQRWLSRHHVGLVQLTGIVAPASRSSSASRPSQQRLTVGAPRGLIRAFGGHYQRR